MDTRIIAELINISNINIKIFVIFPIVITLHVFCCFLGGEWCTTIPASWLILKSQVFKWPPKNKNATKESKKETKPQENWITIPYSKLLGPFDTFEKSREVENNTLDISSNDEKTLAEVTKKKNIEVSNKNVQFKNHIVFFLSPPILLEKKEKVNHRQKLLRKKINFQ